LVAKTHDITCQNRTKSQRTERARAFAPPLPLADVKLLSPIKLSGNTVAAMTRN
jgi:hypothetical protein